MNFQLKWQPEAWESFTSLQQSDPKKWKKVAKTLGYMETNLRHPGLNTHKYDAYVGPKGEEIFESYAENRTPGAFRIFWYYAGQGVITIFAITPHP